MVHVANHEDWQPLRYSIFLGSCDIVLDIVKRRVGIVAPRIGRISKCYFAICPLILSNEDSAN